MTAPCLYRYERSNLRQWQTGLRRQANDRRSVWAALHIFPDGQRSMDDALLNKLLPREELKAQLLAAIAWRAV